jgi:PHD/YefM family antitoxin component YafN of YafNO toxin-antitoxin module
MMEEITQEEFEVNFDFYMNQVENDKKEFLIRLPDGRAVAMIPALDELKDVWDTIKDEYPVKNDHETSESPA